MDHEWIWKTLSTSIWVNNLLKKMQLPWKPCLIMILWLEVKICVLIDACTAGTIINVGVILYFGMYSNPWAFYNEYKLRK